MLALRCRAITTAASALKPAGRLAAVSAAPSLSTHTLGSSSPARSHPYRTTRIHQRTQSGMATAGAESVGGAGVLHIERVPCLSDNYSWLLHEPRRGVTAVVDPAEAEPVAAALQRHGWQLTHILNSEPLLGAVDKLAACEGPSCCPAELPLLPHKLRPLSPPPCPVACCSCSPPPLGPRGRQC
jgi:hypothetical protein